MNTCYHLLQTMGIYASGEDGSRLLQQQFQQQQQQKLKAQAFASSGGSGPYG
jgi:hypothetical protein